MYTMTWIEIKRNGLPYSSHHVSNGFRYAITEDGVYDVYAAAYPTYIYARLYVSFIQPILPITSPEEEGIEANISSSGHLVLKHLPHLEDGQLEVYDLFGRLLLSEAIPTRQSEYISYKSLSTIAPQIFLWRVSAEGKTQAQSKIMRF